MARRNVSIHAAFLASSILALPAMAAEVTPAWLVNPEPGNWLMNHRTYDAQRYAPLDKINTDNVKRPADYREIARLLQRARQPREPRLNVGRDSRPDLET